MQCTTYYAPSTLRSIDRRAFASVMPDPHMALSVRKRHGSERIALRAFELAMKRRKKVMAIHKANSFHMTDGLFPECVRGAARQPVW